MKSLVFIFLLFVFQITYAQDPAQINKAKRNALKLGTPSIPAKIFFSYEHAFTKHISAGGCFRMAVLLFQDMPAPFLSGIMSDSLIRAAGLLKPEEVMRILIRMYIQATTEVHTTATIIVNMKAGTRQI